MCLCQVRPELRFNIMINTSGEHKRTQGLTKKLRRAIVGNPSIASDLPELPDDLVRYSHLMPVARVSCRKALPPHAF